VTILTILTTIVLANTASAGTMACGLLKRSIANAGGAASHELGVSRIGGRGADTSGHGESRGRGGNHA
jgi:hypothetical protein